VKLKDIVFKINKEEIKGSTDIEIENVCYDSRKTRKNCLFVAIKGFKVDGHKFIPDAYAKGARAFVVEKEIPFFPDATLIKVASSRKALAEISNIFYGYPSRKLRLIGVTGTNGKTTITYFLQSIFQEKGVKTGRISTINYDLGGEIYPAIATTPESLELQEFLHKMLNNKVKYVFMEVSSHSLVLHRVDGINFNWAIFTNLSPEHLDFHHNMEDYFRAKLTLFERMPPEGKVLINTDDVYGNRIIGRTHCRIVTYGVKNSADYRATNIKIDKEKTRFQVEIDGRNEDFDIFLPGFHNVYNALAAIGLAREEGIDINLIRRGLRLVKRVPGRLERVDNKANFNIYVDYAHTPSSLEQVLISLKKTARGKLIVVFGCGGDRDPYKRPVMGKIAFNIADYTVITSDNPRSEDPESIILEIERGMIKEGARKGKDYSIFIDREEAIKFALGKLKDEDTLLVAGKGHERVQIFKDKVVPFDDREVICKLLREGHLL